MNASNAKLCAHLQSINYSCCFSGYILYVKTLAVEIEDVAPFNISAVGIMFIGGLIGLPDFLITSM